MPDNNHSTKHAKSIRWREADSLPYNDLSKNLPFKFQFHDPLMKTDNRNESILYRRATI